MSSKAKSDGLRTAPRDHSSPESASGAGREVYLDALINQFSGGEKQEENRRRGGQFQPGQSGNPATQFQPGQSGNPNGRPRVSMTATLRRKVDEQMPGAAATYAEAIAERLCVKAALGDVRAATLIWDRLEGKATQPIELTATEKRREMWMRMVDDLAQKYKKPREQVIEDVIAREPEAAEYLR
ncbi:MAG TPA: DUF5681 domain-containing protein [Blastocatellia bacterium]|nr:DUF5681 domain-containing protein [Blastocatellia bacterium]